MPNILTSTTCGVWDLDDAYKKISAGCWVDYDPIANDDPGTLWGWGYNFHGNLGDNSTVDKSSPVQIPGQWYNFCSGTNGAAGIRNLPGGRTAFFWGRYYTNTTPGARSSPIQISGTGWCKVTVTDVHGAGIKNGCLIIWGCNALGELGQNDRSDAQSERCIPGTQWTDVSLGGNANIFAAGLATKSDGTLWAWGDNGTGQLGIFNNIPRSSPVQVPGTGWTCPLTGRLGVQAGGMLGTTLRLWGNGLCGAIGNNCVINRSTPITVPGVWIDVDLGNNVAYGIRSDNTLWAWGNGNCGALGAGNITSRSSPQQVPGLWRRVAGGDLAAGAIRMDNSLWTWGKNDAGMGGRNTAGGIATSPLQVPGYNWIDIRGKECAFHAKKDF